MYSQVIQLTPETDTIIGHSDTFELGIDLKFINHTSSPASFRWVRKNKIPKSWSFTICDSKQCYGNNDSTGIFDRNANTDGNPCWL